MLSMSTAQLAAALQAICITCAARAGLMGARKRSGGAQAGKRTWGRRRVRRIGVLRRAACGHQSGATFTHGNGEFGAH